MSFDQPSLPIRLYGTEEPADEGRLLKAGALTALLDVGGNLRDIRFRGEEVMRAVSFIVRDPDWATWAPVIENLTIEEDADRFAIGYHATTGESGSRFVYDVRIEGDANGILSYSAKGRAPEGLLTNRTGFVVLHPIVGISGSPVTIRHTDGSVVESRFPETINPVQPMMDLRELTHKTPGGQTVSCLMEGDTYEMEDQRNWTDASYKTYVRPLALPWPYRIEADVLIEQKITLTISGDAVPTIATGPARVALDGPAGTSPVIGLGLIPEDAEAALAQADMLSRLGAHHLICYHDARKGHGRETLAGQIAVAKAIGAEPWLEAVVVAVEDDAAAAELAVLGEMVAELGSPFPIVMVSPAPDLKCTLPGSPWPPAPDAVKLYAAARRAFPGVRIGGGMFSFFTELNRKRPPTEAIDLVTFTTAAIFHAGDDRSCMETLECLPYQTLTLPEITKGVPYSVGPSAIGLRDNPYGASCKANPDNIRQAVNFNDPRQRGLLGAAWALGYLSAYARGGAEAVAIGAPVGAFGVLSVPTDFPQPWYEGKGGLYPIWHVLRGFARQAGHPLRALTISGGSPLAGIAFDIDGATEIWIANTRPDAVEVDLDIPAGAEIAVLDADCFVEAARNPSLLDTFRTSDRSQLTLGAFAVARIVSAKNH